MKKIILISVLMCLSLSICASDLSIPNVFVANTPAVASEVNGNFGAVETAVDDNNSRIAALEATINSMQSTINSLNSRLTAVENNTVLELDGLLQFSMFKGYPTAEFTDVNVQINNGANSTLTANGLGNLIIGYNEILSSAPLFCSDPQYTDSVNCIGNLEMWGRNVYRGSHNMVIGRGNSYDNIGGIVAGRGNVSNGNFASVLGGTSSIASGDSSVVSGGNANRARGSNSSITGGGSNTANSNSTSITGGFMNQTLDNNATVSGGSNRTASGQNDWVAGSLFEDS